MGGTKNKKDQPSPKFKHVFYWVQRENHTHTWEGAGIWDCYIPERDVLPVNIHPSELQLLLTLAHKWHWKFSPTPAEIRRLMGYRANGAMYRSLKSLRRLGLLDWLDPPMEYDDRIRRFVRQRHKQILIAERTLHITERGMHVASVYIGVIPLTKPQIKQEVVLSSFIGYKRKWRRLASPRLAKHKRAIYAKRGVFGYTHSQDRGGV